MCERINIDSRHREGAQGAALETRTQSIEHRRPVAAVERQGVDADEAMPAAVKSEDVEGTTRSIVEIKICRPPIAIARQAASK